MYADDRIKLEKEVEYIINYLKELKIKPTRVIRINSANTAELEEFIASNKRKIDRKFERDAEKNMEKNKLRIEAKELQKQLISLGIRQPSQLNLDTMLNPLLRQYITKSKKLLENYKKKELEKQQKIEQEEFKKQKRIEAKELRKKLVSLGIRESRGRGRNLDKIIFPMIQKYIRI